MSMPKESARTTSQDSIAAATLNRTNDGRIMPTYELEQYELHVTKYRVEAMDKGEAVAKLFAGEADPMDNSSEFVEVADNYGMPVDQNRDLAEKLRKRGIAVGDNIIPSIGSIEEVK